MMDVILNCLFYQLADCSLFLVMKVEFHGLDGYGGPLYIGTGCFHRRETLLGREFSKENKIVLKSENVTKREENVTGIRRKIEVPCKL
jgi:hypothetical protein